MAADCTGELFTAATAAALAEADHTTTVVDGLLNDIASAHSELEPLLVELLALSSLLHQLRHIDVPSGLQPPVSKVVRVGSHICKRVDAVLSSCGNGPLQSGQWALSDAPHNIWDKKMALEACRKTVEVVVEATESGLSEQAAGGIERLRREMMPGFSRLDALLVSCLDSIEHHFVSDNANSSHCSDLDAPPPSTPTTPSVQDMMRSFRDSAVSGLDPEDAIFDAIREAEARPAPECYSHLPGSPLETIQDEDIQMRPARKSHPNYSDMRPQPLRIKQRNSLGASRPTQTYGFFPPASPPPTKALPPIPTFSRLTPPIPPPRSPMRLVSRSPSSSSAPQIPMKSRSRSSSDVTHDSGIASLDSAAVRFSSSSHESVSFYQSHQRAGSYACNNPSATPDPASAPEPVIPLEPVTVPERRVPRFEIIPLRRLETKEKDTTNGGVFFVDTSPVSTILASRHGKFHIKLWDVASGAHLNTLKVQFYVQAQMRSREFFVRSHAILSETLNLMAIATNFGHTIEIWDWARRKKLQIINDAYRWASARGDVYESRCSPLATYHEDKDTIDVYPIIPNSKKPFGKPRVIELRKSGLPHIPKLPELAYSATGPLLVAAAGPRPPRPGDPPPAHAALLMAWQLDGDTGSHKPYRFHQPVCHPELENCLPLCLATYGSVSVSVWEPAKFRTIGKPGMWQVERVTVNERIVLVWDFGGAEDKTQTYRIPDVLACISPDCRFVAYCDPGGHGGSENGALVVLDAIRSGRELWRLDGAGKAGATMTEASDSANGKGTRLSGKSFETWRSSKSSTKLDVDGSSGSPIVGGGGLQVLAADLGKVTELDFSGDGNRLFVGDADGGVAVYEIREGIGMTV